MNTKIEELISAVTADDGTVIKYGLDAEGRQIMEVSEPTENKEADKRE